MPIIDGNRELCYPVSWDYYPPLLQQKIGPVEADFSSYDIVQLHDATGIELYREFEAHGMIRRALTVPVLLYFSKNPNQIPSEYPEGTRIFFLGNLLKDEKIDRQIGWDPTYPLEEAFVPCLQFDPADKGEPAGWHSGLAMKLRDRFTEQDIALFLKEAETA